jgi:predicted exporter
VNGVSRSRRRHAALAWLIVVAALLLHQIQLWRQPDFATDVTALLPHQSDPQIEQASARLIAAATSQWVVMVGAADFELSKRSAAAALAVLDPDRRKLQSVAGGGGLPAELLAELQGARGALLTRESRLWLRGANADQIGERALQGLLQPVGDGFSSWRDDPLGLWGEWLRERAQWSLLRPRDGWLWMEQGGLQWIALPFKETESAFSSWQSGTNSARLAVARERVTALGGDARVMAAGAVLQAEAAAARARKEVSVIGTGSLLAVILLTLVTFGSLRPILLVTLSLVIGCAAALSVTQLLFGQVHLLTLVFGASLVGVAEDYGIHYFAARQGRPVEQRWEQLRQISPGLWLALATSGIAYLALGLAPFPGLRQIAVFSCVGLTAAFLTVLCWFPWLDTRPLRMTGFARAFGRSLDAWPRWPGGWKGLALGVVGLALLLSGLLRLRTVDDIRTLQNVPKQMLAEQLEVGRTLGLSSPAQVFLVHGEDMDGLLRNEQGLTARLAQQQADAELIAAANREAGRALTAVTGEDIDVAPTPPRLLTIAGLGAHSQALPAVGAWQDERGRHYSLVMLQGLDRASLPALAAAAAGLTGVRFIDNAERYSQVLARYRLLLSGLLLVGLAAVMALLYLRYRARAWRAWLPTVIGGLFTLACFGWAGIPLQLFVVLSLVLLLGMGIDYGVFLQEHPGDRAVWLAVAIAGISTLLAFGLLALSTTPALRAFGLAMLIGETTIWLLTPVFREESIHT